MILSDTFSGTIIPACTGKRSRSGPNRGEMRFLSEAADPAKTNGRPVERTDSMAAGSIASWACSKAGPIAAPASGSAWAKPAVLRVLPPFEMRRTTRRWQKCRAPGHDRVDDGLEIQPGLGEPARDLDQLLQRLLGPDPFGHVSKAPDPADHLAAQPLRTRVSLEEAGVSQLQQVEALALGVSVELLDPASEGLGVLEPLPGDRQAPRSSPDSATWRGISQRSRSAGCSSRSGPNRRPRECRRRSTRGSPAGASANARAPAGCRGCR